MIDGILYPNGTIKAFRNIKKGEIMCLQVVTENG